MANTTQRTVELQIKLQGVQTLEQLEQVTSDINSELKNIPINSKAFSEMESLAKKANSQIKQIDENLQGVTSVQKTESLFKLGEGLAGAFAIASSASLVFGEKTSAELEKTIAKVGALVIALDGVKKISEAFSAENLRGLKGVVNGFKESSIAAKLFGTTARTAIAATGIGLLVVILGLIVANWDKVKAATVKAFNALKDYVPIFKIIDIAIEGIQKKFGNLKAFIAGLGAGIKAAFTFGTSINDAFNKAVKESLALQAIDKELLNLTTKRKVEMDNINEVLAAQGGKELEIYNNKIKYNQELIKTLEAKQKSNDLSEEQKTLLNETIQSTKVLTAQRTKYNQDQAKANADKAKADAKEKADAAAKAIEDKKKADDEKKQIQDNYNAKIAAEREYRNTLTESVLIEQSLNRETSIIAMQEAMQNLVTTSDDIAETFGIIEEKRDKFLIQTGIEVQDQLMILQTSIKQLEIEKAANKNKETDLKAQKKFNEDKIKQLDAENIRLTLQGGNEDIIKENALTINALNLDNLKTNNDLYALSVEQLKIDNEINDVKEEGKELIDSTYKTGLKKAKDFTEKYAEEIQVGAQLINQVFELQIAQLERKAELEKRNLADIQAKKQEYADQDKSLNDLLADAEGQRYLDILAQIEANGEAKKANEAAEIESINKINKYEAKAAKARKTQAIIDATIQGALGVVEALPNIFLAALVGALTLASIATIASQPAPEPITLATGGIVKGNSYQGDKVDAKLNSDEMVLNTDQQANLFKQINTKPNVSNNYSSMIDYDLLANKIGDVFAANPQFVSVVEINNAQNKLQVVQNRASIVA